MCPRQLQRPLGEWVNACDGAPRSCSIDRGADERNGSQRLPHNQLCGNAQDAKARATKLCISPGILSHALCVIAAINFDDEPDRRSEEVDDEVAEDDPAAELNAELFAANVQPEPGLRITWADAEASEHAA
jgi:hypothetical protein